MKIILIWALSHTVVAILAGVTTYLNRKKIERALNG